MTPGPEAVALAGETAESVREFLLALESISREADGGTAVPLLLLEVSGLLMAGARLGVQVDFEPSQPYQPDVGPDPDLDRLRLRLAAVLGDLDTYAHNFEPYDPETVPAQLSDDLATIAADVANGLRHQRNGDVEEALWWWQFSYLASWGSLACGVLSALHAVVAHDRLDRDFEDEADQIAAADEVLGGEAGR